MKAERRTQLGTDGVLVIRTPASLDATNAQELVDAVRGAMANETVPVVLDCSETEAVDSSALHVIVAAYKALRGELFLGGVATPVKRMLELTRLDRVLPQRASADDAIAELISRRYAMCGS